MAPAALEDPTAPRKQLSGPATKSFHPEKILPAPITLSDGRSVIIKPFINGYHEAPPREYIRVLTTEMNGEIERGDTYPMDEPMDETGFESYWFGSFAAVLVTVSADGESEVVLGSFHVKPNYPGRCSHVCNGAFLVAQAARGQGVGKILANAFLVYAPLLGYKSSIFNLVFESNVASCKLWDRLGFTRSGRVKDAGRLKVDGVEKYTDAIVYQKIFDVVEDNE